MRQLARGVAIYRDSFRHEYPTADAEFLTVTGITLDQYLACVCGVAIYANVTPESASKNPGCFRLDALGANMSPDMACAVDRYITLESQTADELRAALWSGKTSPDGLTSAEPFNYKPLRDRPILRTPDGRAIILDPVFFSEKTSVGPLFALVKTAAAAGRDFNRGMQPLPFVVHQVNRRARALLVPLRTFIFATEPDISRRVLHRHHNPVQRHRDKRHLVHIRKLLSLLYGDEQLFPVLLPQLIEVLRKTVQMTGRRCHDTRFLQQLRSLIGGRRGHATAADLGGDRRPTALHDSDPQLKRNTGLSSVATPKLVHRPLYPDRACKGHVLADGPVLAAISSPLYLHPGNIQVQPGQMNRVHLALDRSRELRELSLVFRLLERRLLRIQLGITPVQCQKACDCKLFIDSKILIWLIYCPTSG